jgi:hypothetical protein
VAAPLACKFTDPPIQYDGFDGVTVMTGFEFTVTITVAMPEQPAVTPVTVYTVVVAGLATGLAMFGLLKPVVGDHV